MIDTNLQISGVVEVIIYHNEENGFTVLILGRSAEDGHDDDWGELEDILDKDANNITCTGFIVDPVEGESLKIQGKVVDNHRYGKQISITTAERIRPNTLDGIERYLSSGMISGLGARTAKLIVERFGTDAFDILENNPEKLTEIRGISPQRAARFAESFQAQRDMRLVMLFLHEHGISQAAAMRIYKRYKEDTIALIKTNPYKLADDISGIGFKTADAIAYKLGIGRDSPERITAVIKYLLQEASAEGHTYMPESLLLTQASSLLLAPTDTLKNQLTQIQLSGHITRILPSPGPLAGGAHRGNVEDALENNSRPDTNVDVTSAEHNDEVGLLDEASPHFPVEVHGENISPLGHISEASFLQSTQISVGRNLRPTEIKTPHGEPNQPGHNLQPHLPPSSPDHHVFLTHLYRAELAIARNLIALHSYWQPSKPLPATDTDSTPSFGGITLSQGQLHAVNLAMTSGVLIITGGPGTGKTTTINTIIQLLEAKELTIALAAPTGRAAKRMAETTGREAKTIHRLLEVAFVSGNENRQIFNRNEDLPIEADILIVDEASMMDVTLTHSLLKAVAHGTRLILVGDVDQLPSVGAGNVLKDIIDSGTVPVARLTEIFRQAAQSAIITNAHRINKGEYPNLDQRDNDFFFMRKSNQDNLMATILELAATRLPAYKNLDPIQDIQVLSPLRKTPLGVANLNNLLQAKLNPPSPKKKERESGPIIFREGDKVMQIRNNYDATWEIYEGKFSVAQGSGVFNGDMGIITEISDTSGVTVCFDDGRQIVYEPSRLDELELAYAVTVHKSQGSEYRVVIIPIWNGPPMLLNRNLIYTAVTRAKELAVLVGSPDVLFRMIDNNKVAARYTSLTQRLQTVRGIQVG
ncbi:MAG: AAA family ATPase [Defluviitaleaceae bacterium]|nr:AAA family ATPase [Defluviitaleaceae bacterium]